MAVLKILVSVALLGTATRCQDIYSAYSPGGSSGQYSPSILSRGTPRLVPVKVRSSASRFFPSYFYPGPPPLPSPYRSHPHHPHTASSMSPMQALSSSYTSQSNYPRHQQLRSALTGYYRTTRQSSIYNNPFHESGQPVAYHTSATTAPVVLKRGRVLAAPSPYSLEAASAASQSTATALGGFPYSQSVPAVSTYRPPPPQYQPQQQFAASPVYHQPQPQVQAQPQYQPPAYYTQKSPAVLGAGRPVKVAKVTKKLPRPVEVEEAEEEYASDPNPQYNFSFDIKDDELTNYQNRQEERDGQTIKGSYSVVDPDGYVRTVTYTADPKNGFQAKVTREPTDVKIKFPAPYEAPAAAEQSGVIAAGKQGAPRRVQYANPQAQYQPQYQDAAYATPQVYASQPQVQAQPQYVPRVVSRFAGQPQSSVSSPRARISRRARRPTVATPEQEQDQQ